MQREKLIFTWIVLPFSNQVVKILPSYFYYIVTGLGSVCHGPQIACLHTKYVSDSSKRNRFICISWNTFSNCKLEKEKTKNRTTQQNN